MGEPCNRFLSLPLRFVLFFSLLPLFFSQNKNLPSPEKGSSEGAAPINSCALGYEFWTGTGVTGDLPGKPLEMERVGVRQSSTWEEYLDKFKVLHMAVLKHKTFKFFPRILVK